MVLLRPVLAILLALAAAGCASARDTQDGDPLESVNRKIFAFNHVLDDRAALPAATFYKSTTPDGVRDGIHNFISNLSLPVTFANDVLQGHVKRAGEAVGRLCVNTTIGVAGIFDPATDMGLPEHREDFGQTLGVYGVPGGPYLVLPLLGAALPRDLAGRIFVDHYFNPLGYVAYHGKLYVSLGQQVLGTVDQRSRVVDRLRTIERTSVDYYAAMRERFLQHRQDEIENVAPQPGDPPTH